MSTHLLALAFSLELVLLESVAKPDDLCVVIWISVVSESEYSNARYLLYCRVLTSERIIGTLLYVLSSF